MTEYNFGNTDVASIIGQETPTGTIDGVNTAFNLADTPIVGSETISISGVDMYRGIDYNIAGNVITFVSGSIPQSGETLRATYAKASIPIELAGLTNKGDLLTSDGSAIDKIGVGTEGQVLTVTGASPTGLAYTTPSGGGGSGVTQNSIINSDFLIWQRGLILTSSGYSADRWLANFGNGAGAIIRGGFGLGQVDVPDEPIFFLRLDQTVLSSVGTPTVSQRIESVRSLANKQVTVSFYAKAGGVLNNQNVSLVQNFGTGGAPSADVVQQIDGGVFDLTTAWQKFTFTATLASITGKTLGTAGDDFLGLSFQFDLNAVYTIDISHVQVEEGTVASSFVKLTKAEELTKCQRYYYKTYNLESAPGLDTEAGLRVFDVGTLNDAFGSLDFPAAMRVDPAVVLYSKLGSAGAVSDIANADLSGVVASPVSETGVYKVTRVGSPGFSGLDKVLAHVVADSEL